MGRVTEVIDLLLGQVILTVSRLAYTLLFRSQRHTTRSTTTLKSIGRLGDMYKTCY